MALKEASILLSAAFRVWFAYLPHPYMPPLAADALETPKKRVVVNASGERFESVRIETAHVEYLILFTKETIADALRRLGSLATDPKEEFTWYNAAVASQRIREAAKQFRAAEREPSENAAPDPATVAP